MTTMTAVGSLWQLRVAHRRPCIRAGWLCRRRAMTGPHDQRHEILTRAVIHTLHVRLLAASSLHCQLESVNTTIGSMTARTAFLHLASHIEQMTPLSVLPLPVPLLEAIVRLQTPWRHPLDQQRQRQGQSPLMLGLRQLLLHPGHEATWDHVEGSADLVVVELLAATLRHVDAAVQALVVQVSAVAEAADHHRAALGADRGTSESNRTSHTNSKAHRLVLVALSPPKARPRHSARTVTPPPPRTHARNASLGTALRPKILLRDLVLHQPP